MLANSVNISRRQRRAKAMNFYHCKCVETIYQPPKCADRTYGEDIVQTTTAINWLWQHRVVRKSAGSNTVPVQVRSWAPNS